MLHDLLSRRCSVREFREQPIPDHVVWSILEAGRQSPSGGNEQPWRFGVAKDPELIGGIAGCSYNQQWLRTSPLLIVLVTKIVADERGGRDIQIDRFPRWKQEIEAMDKDLYSSLNMEEHQTKIPGAHMILQALEHGVYSTWVSRFDVHRVAELMALPELHIPSEIIAFGYPAKEPKRHSKKSLEELVFTPRAWSTPSGQTKEQ